LNPFETLQIDPYISNEELKKKYRKLAAYVHPDKNPDDKERAQIAFEAVSRAYKILNDEKQRKEALEVVDEARERVEKMCDEKRKKLKRETKDPKLQNEIKIDEDDPDKYRHAVYVMTCKLFADIERLKVRESEKKMEERKRKAEEKSTEESQNKIKKEWDENYEVNIFRIQIISNFKS
jgi:DnaJ homolog subfamily C member 8